MIEEKRKAEEYGDAYESHPSGKLAHRIEFQCATSYLAQPTTHVCLTRVLHPASVDDDADVQDVNVAYKIAQELRTIGTSLFKKGDFATAQAKCRFHDRSRDLKKGMSRQLKLAGYNDTQIPRR